MHLNDVHGISEKTTPQKYVNERNKFLPPVEMIDKGRQTEGLCNCDATLQGFKWKDTLLVRHWMNLPQGR